MTYSAVSADIAHHLNLRVKQNRALEPLFRLTSYFYGSRFFVTRKKWSEI